MAMLKPLIAFIATSVLLRHLNRRHRRRRSRDEQRRHKQEVQRWEGEGGNLPV